MARVRYMNLNPPEEYPANRLLGRNFWAKLLGLALIWVLKVTDGLGVWIVRLDELSVKFGVSLFCLDTVELVELPVNWKKSIETKVVEKFIPIWTQRVSCDQFFELRLVLVSLYQLETFQASFDKSRSSL